MEGNLSFDPPRAPVGYCGDIPDSLGRMRRELSTLVMKFNVEEFERTIMEMDEKLTNKTEMQPHQSNDAARTPCRRAGLDRRWIPSKNHHPERRRGGDRRSMQRRSFSDPLVLEVTGKAEPSIAGFESVSQALEPESSAITTEENRIPEANEDRNKKVLPERQ